MTEIPDYARAIQFSYIQGTANILAEDMKFKKAPWRRKIKIIDKVYQKETDSIYKRLAFIELSLKNGTNPGENYRVDRQVLLSSLARWYDALMYLVRIKGTNGGVMPPERPIMALKYIPTNRAGQWLTRFLKRKQRVMLVEDLRYLYKHPQLGKITQVPFRYNGYTLNVDSFWEGVAYAKGYSHLWVNYRTTKDRSA